MSVVLGFNRRNLGALGLAAAVLAAAYLIADPVVQYGAWLVVFTIWMSWFIFAGIEWLRNADF